MIDVRLPRQRGEQHAANRAAVAHGLDLRLREAVAHKPSSLEARFLFLLVLGFAEVAETFAAAGG